MNEEELKREIEEMEKLAEVFINKNKYVLFGKKGGYKPKGIDAIMELTNFVLNYDRRAAVLNYMEEKEE